MKECNIQPSSVSVSRQVEFVLASPCLSFSPQLFTSVFISPFHLTFLLSTSLVHFTLSILCSFFPFFVFSYSTSHWTCLYLTPSSLLSFPSLIYCPSAFYLPFQQLLLFHLPLSPRVLFSFALYSFIMPSRNLSAILNPLRYARTVCILLVAHTVAQRRQLVLQSDLAGLFFICLGKPVFRLAYGEATSGH